MTLRAAFHGRLSTWLRASSLPAPCIQLPEPVEAALRYYPGAVMAPNRDHRVRRIRDPEYREPPPCIIRKPPAERQPDEDRDNDITIEPFYDDLQFGRGY